MSPRHLFDDSDELDDVLDHEEQDPLEGDEAELEEPEEQDPDPYKGAEPETTDPDERLEPADAEAETQNVDTHPLRVPTGPVLNKEAHTKTLARFAALVKALPKGPIVQNRLSREQRENLVAVVAFYRDGRREIRS